MGAEVRVSPMGDAWTQWEGQVINGTFPLRRCLGISDHSGVFLTEHAALEIPNAALKLVPLIPTLAESQLSHWAAAAAITHPNLIRLFKMGRCQLGSQHYLYVVMDYAEQNLGHLLQHRPLTETEVREMLPLTLDALAFLHGQGLVQGQLKPSNILVVGNQLKLASDTIRPADEATASIGTLSLYNPPEARDGSCSTAGDIWALGVTLCQALTTRLPSRSGERSDDLVLPPDLPVSFVSVIRRCLIRNPAIRPNVSYLRDWVNRDPNQPESAARDSADRASAAALDSAAHEFDSRDLAELGPRAPGATEPIAAAAPAPQSTPPVGVKPDTNIPTQRATPPAALRADVRAHEASGQRSFAPMALAAVVLVAIGWGAVHFLSGRSNTTAPAGAPETSDTASPTAPPSAATPPANRSPPTAPSSAVSSGSAPSHATRAPTARQSHAARSAASSRGAEPASVVHEEIPSVPLHARQTIHGHVKVAVLVTVNNSGVVVSDTLNNPGPSRYFARLASESAKRWKFTPAPTSTPRRWLVHFEFSRDGTKAHATPSG